MTHCGKCGIELAPQALRGLCPGCLFEVGLGEGTGSLAGLQLSHYELLEDIGQGGMGLVYKARDVRLDRLVAVKVLLDDARFTEELLRRFEREAWTASRLNHPNICTIYDVGEFEGRPFIVMELIEGETVSQRMSAARLPLDTVLEVAARTADALRAAHEKGIVHRDIKPSNIMLTRSGLVKVLDFGLAKNFRSDGGDLTTITSPQAALLGTVFYMSPEQVSGETVDHRSDLFALGVTIFEMATGRHPFQRNSTPATMKAILLDPPSFQPEMEERLPAALRSILGRLLEKKPEKRHQAAAQVVSELNRMRAGSRPRGTARRTFARLPLAAALAAILILLFILLWTRLYIPEPAAVRGGFKVVAVLPFHHYGNDGEGAEWLAAGMTDALISRLAGIQGLSVPSTTTMLHYRNSGKTLAAIGRELHAEALVEGSVQIVAGRLFCRVRMMDPGTERQILGPLEFEDSVARILQLQTRIAETIAEDIRSQLSPAEKAQLLPERQDPEAYLQLLKGRYLLEKRDSEALRSSIGFFEEALTIDPGYAQAYAGLADAFLLLSATTSFVEPSSLVIPKARAAARKALEYDPTLAEAHTSLASIAMSFDWDWPTAQMHFERAIQLQPDYPAAHHWHGLYLAARGDLTAAQKEIETAQRLDPLSPVTATAVGRIHYYRRQYSEAKAEYGNVLSLEPGFRPAHLGLGLLFLKQQDFEAAAAQFEKGVAPGVQPLTRLFLQFLDKEDRLLPAQQALLRQQDVSPFYVALIYSALAGVRPEKKEEALDWLESSFDTRSEYLVYIGVDPIFDPIRDHPRFVTLLKRIGL